jgi:Pyruvate/2-oxoacid:ferredoxin oxidoreductase delta subunit
MKTTKPLKAKKRMNKVGKIGKALAKQSREYRKENPPNHEGYYTCYLCGKWIPANEMNPEHTKSRARHPEFRFDKGKLKPACGICNEKKRSMEVEEVREMQRRGLW